MLASMFGTPTDKNYKSAYEVDLNDPISDARLMLMPSITFISA